MRGERNSIVKLALMKPIAIDEPRRVQHRARHVASGVGVGTEREIMDLIDYKISSKRLVCLIDVNLHLSVYTN